MSVSEGESVEAIVQDKKTSEKESQNVNGKQRVLLTKSIGTRCTLDEYDSFLKRVVEAGYQRASDYLRVFLFGDKK